jgi:hypothetical protein
MNVHNVLQPVPVFDCQVTTNQLRMDIASHTTQLSELSTALKSELYGIDDVIDRVIESMRAWYVLPDLINRPVVICLWGLTGTGKTQLTRSIAKKLGFYDRFVEVQMDGFSNGSGYRSDSISRMLSDSGIKEATPGILVLDEFQRFRTIGVKGEEVKVERYQDVWTLLSDGRLAPTLSFMNDIEYTLADSHYDQEREKSDGAEGSSAQHVFKLKPYEARSLKRCLKLKESLIDIMAWNAEQVQAQLKAFRLKAAAWETDYSKLLIFVSGNLDEMYEDVAKSVQDCDTDADIFSEMTRKLSIIDVKKALSERFKPEQIARLGNEHVIYPSFDRATYQKLIEKTCQRYLRDIESVSHLQFEIDPQIYAEIYKNSVFPSQGTRPLFSSIHAILSAPLVNATLWAIQHGATVDDRILVTFDAGGHLVVHLRKLSVAYPVRLELNHLKQRTDRNFRALLAVHEAGHGLLYGLLFGQPPQELKINVGAFEGGYASFVKQRVESRQNCLDRICVGLGGRVAEVWIFGQDASTTGAKGDIAKATALAAKFTRHYGFEMHLSRTDISQVSGENLNTDVGVTNSKIEALLNEQYARAEDLLKENRSIFLKIVHELVEFGEVTRGKFCDLLGIDDIDGQVPMGEYANQLAAFESGTNLMERMAANSLPQISQH